MTALTKEQLAEIKARALKLDSYQGNDFWEEAVNLAESDIPALIASHEELQAEIGRLKVYVKHLEDEAYG